MPDIEGVLDELRNNLGTTEDEIAKNSKIRDILKADVEDMSKKSDEINKVMDSYSKVFEDIKKQKEKIADYIVTMKPKIETALKRNEKDQIDNLIKDFKDKKETKEKEIEGLKTSQENAITLFEKAQKGLDEEQQKFDNYLEELQNNIETEVKKLTDLRDSIEKTDEEQERGKRYFLIVDLESENSKDLIDKGKLKENLATKWNALKAAKEKYRLKEEEMLTAQNKLKEEEGNLKSLIEKRDQKILKEISSLEGQ